MRTVGFFQSSYIILMNLMFIFLQSIKLEKFAKDVKEHWNAKKFEKFIILHTIIG